jgi:hypothetical protein
MAKPYKLLICRRSTGQVLNLDTKTLFSGSDIELPYLYFHSLMEAEGFAQELTARIRNLEVPIYEGDVYLKDIYSQE